MTSFFTEKGIHTCSEDKKLTQTSRSLPAYVDDISYSSYGFCGYLIAKIYPAELIPTTKWNGIRNVNL